MAKVHVLDHPLILHKLSLMRKKQTSTNEFRTLMKEVSLLMGYEVTRSLPVTFTNIETPLVKTKAPFLQDKDRTLISIMRAGQGLLEGFLQLMPTSKVGHIGLYREARAQSIVEYYIKFPEAMGDHRVYVLDPMLATGMSAVSAVSRIKEANPQSITFVCLLASPEGIEYFHTHHKDVSIYTASIDERLDENKYIVPGLGDAGDRLFGTQ